ncbi:MAG: glycine cleavage T C-terminal barrel domain-containing protein [Chloroflexi bacterium OHK40]
MTETSVVVALPRAYADAYAAALEGVALYDNRARGRVWMRDRDRAALLHRLSTNHIERLKPGEGAQTVLTTPIGRIIDLLAVYALDDALLLVTSPGRGPAIFNLLRKNIFFNDKVRPEDASSTLGQLTLYGPEAPAALGALGIPGAALPPWGIAEASWGGARILVARSEPIGGEGLSLIAPPEALTELGAALVAGGARHLDEATYEVLRVEQGYGAYGRELSQEYIPLETGLWGAVSFHKGCYVGQEIIARMESRGRLAKQLRGLRLEAAPALPAQPTAPLAKLDAGGKEAGDLTSVVDSPRYGLIALAYVRTAYAAPGTRLSAAGVAAEVVELPFGG